MNKSNEITAAVGVVDDVVVVVVVVAWQLVLEQVLADEWTRRPIGPAIFKILPT